MGRADDEESCPALESPTGSDSRGGCSDSKPNAAARSSQRLPDWVRLGGSFDGLLAIDTTVGRWGSWTAEGAVEMLVGRSDVCATNFTADCCSSSSSSSSMGSKCFAAPENKSRTRSSGGTFEPPSSRFGANFIDKCMNFRRATRCAQELLGVAPRGIGWPPAERLQHRAHPPFRSSIVQSPSHWLGQVSERAFA